MTYEGGTIGSYRILHLLEQGSMGEIYAGEHVLLHRRAAIKVLQQPYSADHEAMKRFFNEARAVTQIADPGVVQVFDFGYHDGAAYMVMELLEGETLERRLGRAGPFAPLECCRLIKLLCNALAAAHGKGIVHRDLKPENIFIVGDAGVTGGERPKIVDFGIAKLSASLAPGVATLEGIVMGTPLYMSPEQCRGDADVDHRADIYSVGCLMIAMLTGKPPFDQAATGDVMRAHRREVPPILASRGLPDVFDCVIGRCVAKLACNRYQSMTDLVEAMRRVERILERRAA